MSDGNKRILGDVWINEENLNRQREFFRDIIESYQDKYGGEFDASTLQGLRASDFATAEQGALAANAIQDPLWLGRKRIANIDSPQFIYTDAVRLDKDETNTDSSAYQLANNSWFADDDNVTDALMRIYFKVQEIRTEMLSEFDDKLDEELFDTFLTEDFDPIKTIINNAKTEFTDINTGDTKIGLNASLVNGIRPILITEDAYNDLKESEDENDQNIINDWRNFFIFVDSLPSTYNQPWEYSLTDPYSFRIHDGFLQVRNNVNTEWANIAPLEDFLSGANFDNIIKTYLTTANDFNIQSTSLLNSLHLLSATTINENWSDYPFLSSLLHDDYIQNIKFNGSSNYITASVDPTTSFKGVDINLTQILKDYKILKANGSSNIQAISSKVNANEANISQLDSSVRSIQNDIDNTMKPQLNDYGDRITANESNIETNKNNITTLQGNVGNVRYGWTKTYFRNNADTASITNVGEVWYNKELSLCCVYINGLYFDHNGSKAGEWEYPDARVPWFLRPPVPLYGSTSNPNMEALINDLGVIRVKHSGTKSTRYGIWASFMYNYRAW